MPKPVNNIQISVKRSNFTLVFFKAVCCANPDAVKNELNQVHIFDDTYLKNSQYIC